MSSKYFNVGSSLDVTNGVTSDETDVDDVVDAVDNGFEGVETDYNDLSALVALDKTLVVAAAKKLLGHPRMRGRIEGMKLIEAIGMEDLHVFADQVVHVIRNQDPSYVTYHFDRPAKFGLVLFDRLNIKEGMDLCAETIWPGIWGQKYRISGKRGRLEQLKKYGAAAKYLIPKLKETKIREMEDVIKAIEASKVERKFITLEEAKAAGKE